jgi:hypothetical protein
MKEVSILWKKVKPHGMAKEMRVKKIYTIASQDTMASTSIVYSQKVQLNLDFLMGLFMREKSEAILHSVLRCPILHLMRDPLKETAKISSMINIQCTRCFAGSALRVRNSK